MKRITHLLVAARVALLVPLSAHAIDLGEAKQQRLVGETDTGYLAAVSSPNDEIRKLVNSINAKRKAQYEKIAKKNGVPLGEVEKLAAKKAIEKTPSGQMVRIGASWRKK